MKHTPGEWKKVGRSIEHEGGGLICDLFITDVPFEEMEANARLIAAAPELLETLKEALPPEDHSGWWCPTCKCTVPGKEVTFEEYHES